jgi:hypothetical protein
MGDPVEIDLCMPCQALWFDLHEDMKLTEGSTRTLMDLIRKDGSDGDSRIADVLCCPRCAGHLRFVHDLQADTHFSYWRCDQHGKLIRFLEFMKEKSYIRELSREEIEDLRQKIGIIHCANCGAAIDLGKGSRCAYCGSPVSMLKSGVNFKEQTQ